MGLPCWCQHQNPWLPTRKSHAAQGLRKEMHTTYASWPATPMCPSALASILRTSGGNGLIVGQPKQKLQHTVPFQIVKRLDSVAVPMAQHDHAGCFSPAKQNPAQSGYHLLTKAKKRRGAMSHTDQTLALTRFAQEGCPPHLIAAGAPFKTGRVKGASKLILTCCGHADGAQCAKEEPRVYINPL